MILDNTQLFELTKKKRSSAQAAVLSAMGIEHRVRPDGSVAVSEAHVERVLGGEAISSKPKKYELDRSTVR
jgi:hypothetical protein